LAETLYQPKELAAKCCINISTLNGYLRDKELFPPIKVDQNNGFRFYDDGTVITIELFKKLRKKPFRLTVDEVRPIIKKYDLATRAEILSKPNNELLMLLNENTLL